MIMRINIFRVLCQADPAADPAKCTSWKAEERSNLKMQSWFWFFLEYLIQPSTASFIGCFLPLLFIATSLCSKTSVLLQLSNSSLLSCLPPRHNPSDFFPWHQPPSLQMILRVSPDLSSELGNQTSNRFHGKALTVPQASSLILCKEAHLLFLCLAVAPTRLRATPYIQFGGSTSNCFSIHLSLLLLPPELRLLPQAHTHHTGMHEPHREPCLRPWRE